jgi:hypothetical protein
LAYPEQGLKLQIYRLRRPEVLSLVPLIPLQKLPVRFSPEGLEKKPHILWVFFLTFNSVFPIFNSPRSEFLLKFNALTVDFLGEKRARDVSDLVMSLEEVSHVQELMQRLTHWRS